MTPSSPQHTLHVRDTSHRLGKITDLGIELPLLAGTSAKSSAIRRELIQRLPREKWLLASQLQKAIRRGLSDFAYATASILCEVDRRYVVRRLPVIAYEDIGVANPPLLALVKHALRAAPSILSSQDAADLVGGIASVLAASPKSRTACDIASLVAVHLSSADIGKRISTLRQDAIAETAANRDAPLIERAIAWRHLATRRRFIEDFVKPHDGPDWSFASLLASGRAMHVPDEVLRLVMIGQGTYDLNCYLPLAHETVFGNVAHSVNTARAKHTTSFGPILECAVDIYTRIGQSAYRKLVASQSGLRKLLDMHLRRSNRVRAVGTLLFYLEGSLLDQSIVSDASKALLAEVEKEEARDCGFVTTLGARSVRRWLRDHPDHVALARHAAFDEAMDPNPVDGGCR